MDRWVKRTWLKNSIKKLVFSRVDATLGHGEESRQFAMKSGVPPHKALKLPHVINVDHYANGATVARLDRQAFRSTHRLRGTTYIYVGRLWWGKGLNYLLEAFEQVQIRTKGEVSLLLVGDGPEEEALKRYVQATGIRNVTFAGFRQKCEVPIYYAASDVFVFPTLGDPYGLVVDEAMACSLPVISTTAAGEIGDRVVDGETGFLVPPANSEALGQSMLRLAHDPELRARMGRSSFAKMRDRKPEQWAVDFERVVHRILYE
jgi:glycosyltransferase involved in cell wall biosynthesis